MSEKYNRTFHLPWSKGSTSDDKKAKSALPLINVPIVILEKLDGSNSCLERNAVYARTHSSIPTHQSFDHLKAKHAEIKHLIPEKYQLFGENVYAKHSIAYSNLSSYFFLFNVRIDNAWLSWEEVTLWAQEINVPTVPVLFSGIVNSERELEALTESFMQKPCEFGEREGVVIRVANEFNNSDFSKLVQKCVRKNHVNTSEHWVNQAIVKNQLKEK